ncbi:MAG: beta-hydroxyacyl-ACP dehydratase [Prevotella sp.]|nr:beta-hydroxyacyl-ACP dehydratase [Prevotella sp.]MBQ9561191.1 beta-hydroxyacyl-ACP dehydratase [Prevotella sp.]MBR1839136.1 beta-hydroxyacyl-ACP dehydratase [Prevotella sp.]
MFLENKFYKILKEDKQDMSATYRVSILPDCNVYDGHFPGDPVCPGVCNIETIKECAIRLVGKNLRIQSIKQCRLTAIATPTVCPEVNVTVSATPKDNVYIVLATIADEKQTYMEFKGTLG